MAHLCYQSNTFKPYILSELDVFISKELVFSQVINYITG